LFSGSIPCANFWPYHIDRISSSSVESFCVVVVARVGKGEEGRKGGREKWNKEGDKKGDKEGYKGRGEEGNE
jgi:hypothetical protein